MSRSEAESRTDHWTAELNSIGRTEIRTDASQISWWYLAVALGVIVVVVISQVVSGEFTFLHAFLALTMVFGLVGGLVYWGFFRHRKKALIVDRISLTLLDGYRLDWPEIERIVLVSGGKSGPGLSIEVTQRAWDRYLNKQSAYGRLGARLNKTALRRRTIYIPAIFGDKPHEISKWLNQFSQAGQQAPGKEQF